MGPGTNPFNMAGKRKSFKGMKRSGIKTPRHTFKMKNSMRGVSAPRLPSVRTPRSSMFKPKMTMGYAVRG